MSKNQSEHITGATGTSTITAANTITATTGTTTPLLCTCDACHYTFNPSMYHSKFRIPKRCPDCGKMKVDGRPAVREATEEEIEEYKRVQEEMVEEMGM